MTCVDQIKGSLVIRDLDGAESVLPASLAPEYIASKLNLKLSHVSSGPTAEDVKYLGS